MNVGFIQFNPVRGDVESNLETVSKLLADVEADIMVLPELFNTGYSFSSADEIGPLAEDAANGKTTRRLIKASRENDVCLIAGFAENEGGKLYNSAIVVDKEYIGSYRKVHLYGTEKKLFTAGTEFETFPVRGINLGVMICYDWYYPESMRTLALAGADLIAHPANLVMPYCPDGMVTRCLENMVWAVTSDRVGSEGAFTFKGMSQVTSPKGDIIYRASEDNEEVKVFEIDVELSKNKNLNRYNNIFDDRQTNAYKL